MAKKLVIVESPSKSKTIEQYLGSDYIVRSSKGHIRDLAISGPGGLGIDINNKFHPTYKVLPDKKVMVKELNEILKKSSELYLATDPDREGEAISWHLLQTLDVKNKPVKRVIFNEITKDAIREAFEHPKEIDDNLVESQETRRILDRIIGFKLSKLLQNKIKSKSAGRVQSAALKLITDREKEVEAFVPQEYYEVKALFDGFEADLYKYKGHSPKLPSQEYVDEILESIKEEFIVSSVETKNKSFFSRMPFITSTLQQEASTRFNYNSKKTMEIAQKLYEGIQIGTESVGLITYMRTDSTRLSEVYTHQATDYIERHFGKDYVGYVRKNVEKKNIQDAHEAIRPTSVARTPETIKQYLKREEYKLYKLIYDRTLAYYMKPAIREITTILLENNYVLFKASSSKLIFDGYLKVYQSEDEDNDMNQKLIPEVKQNQVLKAIEIKKTQLFTNPPARFTEARLIKEMDDLGIGRPSTYAQTIYTLKNRKYVTYMNHSFFPTEQGTNTIDKLDEFFHEFISSSYSKNMENMLDDIAKNKESAVEELQKFYDYFIPLVEKATKKMEKESPKETGELCPKCGSPMVYRQGRFGEFEACSNYPKCRYIKPSETKEVSQTFDTHVECPECHVGTLIKRTAKKGKNKGNFFFGCSNYPKCRYISPLTPLNEKCPNCGNELVKDEHGHKMCIDQKNCKYHEH